MTINVVFFNEFSLLIILIVSTNSLLFSFS